MTAVDESGATMTFLVRIPFVERFGLARFAHGEAESR